PDERWIVSDMRDINLQQQFDAILAWHSFFHLDHDSQRNMFKIFESHTKPGGVLAFTSGEKEGEVWSDNGGQQLYHASLSTKEYESLLKNSSFKVLVHKVCDPECGEATVWVAQKI
ncbi:class I SAM-dependent methyltransferase, partial [Legionella pneumophila]